jgi:serine phosphatase RsbU (regulator of sigma subunit)
MILDKILNIGAQKIDDVQGIRLTRQTNGLSLFYFFVAISIGVVVNLLIPRVFFVSIMQYVAACFYLFAFLLVARGKLKLARSYIIIVFEWHIFIGMLLLNAYRSEVLFLVILYPLMAALVEVSIFRHVFISILQFCILIALNKFFPNIEQLILSFSSITAQESEVIRILDLVYIPMMTAVIINIIFKENIRAREKQKQMLNEITIANRQLELYATELKDETRRLRTEIEIAQRIQTMVLPDIKEINAIKNLDIACMMRPAEEVGGDYYDLIKIGEVVTIGIGDVTGHGLSSGLIMLMAQTAIRTIAEMNVTDPVTFLTILNNVLYANIARIKEDKNMTLIIMVHRDGKYYLSGMHESLLIYRQNGKLEILDTSNMGFYIGMIPKLPFKIPCMEIRLEKDEIMILYSDGLTEAVNEKNEQFGLQRLTYMLKKYHELPAEKIKYNCMKDLYNFMGDAKVHDDISIVIIKQK